MTGAYGLKISSTVVINQTLVYFCDVLANHSQMLCVHSTDEVFTIDVTSVDSHFPYLCATADS